MSENIQIGRKNSFLHMDLCKAGIKAPELILRDLFVDKVFW